LLDFEPIINPSTNDVFVVIKHKDTATPFRYPATLTDPNHSYPVVQKTITIPATGTLPTIPPLDFITTQIPFAGVSGTPPISNILLNLNDIEITQKLAIDVVGTGTDSITVRVFNFTSTPYSEAVTLAATATLFEEIDATEERVDLSFNISLVKTSYENNVTENMYWTMLTLANKINTHPVLSNWVRAEYEWQGSSSLQIYSTVTGEISKQLSLDVFHTNAIPASPVPINNDIPSLMDYVQLKTLKAVNYPGINNYSSSTKANFNVYDASEQDAILTKIDSPINAGDGASPISLTGITERLPLGILLQDSDFLCEDPLNDNVSGMKASPAVLQPIQNLLVPTQSNNYQTYISNTASGEEYDRFTGEPGILLTLSEGTASPIIYTPYTDITPTGTRLYRTYRGSTAFVLSGTKPGGPIDWVAGAFPAPMRPVLKGGLLACRALLVRGFIESSMQPTPFYGDEIQMVMLTYGILGNTETRTKGISMHGTISPTGYGEGYAAADRYRIGGHPMFRAFTRKVPDPATVAVAPYPERRIY
jgi:hypothetical protein